MNEPIFDTRVGLRGNTSQHESHSGHALTRERSTQLSHALARTWSSALNTRIKPSNPNDDEDKEHMKLKRTKATLPEIPPGVEDHPRWREFTGQQAQHERSIARLRESLAAIDADRTAAASELSEARVAEALGESVGDRVSKAKTRVRDIDERHTELRESLAAAIEAARRFAQREPSIRREIAAETQTAVMAAYVRLVELFGEQLEAMAPINRELLRLRSLHAGIPEIAAGVYFDDLIPRRVDGLQNRAAAFIDRAAALGIHVEL